MTAPKRLCPKCALPVSVTKPSHAPVVCVTHKHCIVSVTAALLLEAKVDFKVEDEGEYYVIYYN